MEKEIKDIEERAEAKYPTLSINLVAGMPASDFNRSERLAYIAGATEERQKAKPLVTLMQEYIDFMHRHNKAMGNRFVSEFTEALTSYTK